MKNSSVAIDPDTWRLGAEYRSDGSTRFLVWAPYARQVMLLLKNLGRSVELSRLENGYFAIELDDAPPGARYRYMLDGGKPLPDPASRFQPKGVFGPSMVVDQNQACGQTPRRPQTLAEYVVYELHVGAYTPEGTFSALVKHLPRLQELGVSAIELMPVAQFSGRHNWGYDGVFPFATHNAYGKPGELCAFVDACHQLGMSAILDVVYNHLGPEGNCLAKFGPYFSRRHHTPWGPAINFDGRHSGPVRRFFLENAEHWLRDFGFDALRLDAVHAIFDDSPVHILAELQQRIEKLSADLGRPLFAIAESNQNIARLVRPVHAGGFGLAAQWIDDFQRSLHALLTGERNGYYVDYGQVEQLAQSLERGFVFTGQFSQYRQRPQGEPCEPIPPDCFLACAQNHDAVGNRLAGERMCQLIDWPKVKLAAVATILSPFVPLIFMGEEHGEVAPFLYFVDHQSESLRQQTREGRIRDFAKFQWQTAPPDPADENTFLRSKLNHHLQQEARHGKLLRFYQRLLKIRREHPVWLCPTDSQRLVEFSESPARLSISWIIKTGAMLLKFNFSDMTLPKTAAINDFEQVLFDSNATEWRLFDEVVEDSPTAGALSPWSAQLIWRPA